MKVRHIEVVDAFHPVWVNGVLRWPTETRGVIDERGTLYVTDGNAEEAKARVGRQ